MERKIKPLNIILIITIPTIAIILIGLLFYININKTIEITATVKYISNNYIIVKDIDTKDEYQLKTNTNKYKLKDKLKLQIYQINNNTEPKEATIKKEKLITEPIINEEINTYDEDETINFFHELNNDLDSYQIDKKLQEKIDNNYKKAVNYLFYEEEINQKKFDQLSNNDKTKILKITMSIDSKINKILPEYKEELEDKYKNIKAKIVEKYLDTVVKICEEDKDKCIEIKKELKELRDNFYISWTYIKNIKGVEPEKLKKWHEVWREA